MGRLGFFFFGDEDEIKVKELQKLIGIKDYEEAKEVYIELKNRFKD